MYLTGPMFVNSRGVTRRRTDGAVGAWSLTAAVRKCELSRTGPGAKGLPPVAWNPASLRRKQARNRRLTTTSRPLLCGALLNFVGYSTVRAFYNGAIPIRTAPDLPASRPLVFLLALFMFMTGSAGSAGLTSGMNAVAKSYPDRSRAAYTGAVLAGFGLSAFLFSMLGHAIFHGEAGGLLLLLSIGTSVPHLVGSFIVRAYPPEDEGEGEDDGVHDGDDLDPEEECALARQVSLGASAEGQVLLRRSSELERALEFELSDDAATPLSSDPLIRKRSPVKHSRTDSTASLPPTKIHFTPLEAMKQTDFHLIFSVLAILCGVGLEWINNVGVSKTRRVAGGGDSHRSESDFLVAGQNG